jgi:hypothetical protein
MTMYPQPRCCCVQVTDLRSKARLLVHQGATLVGVMDEYGVLQEGQVYLQVGGRCLCHLPDRLAHTRRATYDRASTLVHISKRRLLLQYLCIGNLLLFPVVCIW